MSLIVQKFGGTSVGSPDRIRSVAHTISKTRAEGHSLVVVVSAMGHTTDELIQLARQVSPQPPAREMDMLLTAGERISMALLSMALAEEKVPALSFTGSQSGIITDGSHRRARIRRILGNRVREAMDGGKVAIVAGFQGVSEAKEITTLGRGGSDTTAVALAAALGAERCEIYTDVEGVYSADPRIVSNAQLLERISFNEMIELAYRGAGVLHPRCVELAKHHGVAIHVVNSLRAGAKRGTQVDMEGFAIQAVSADVGKALLTIHLSRPSVLGAIWEGSAQAHLLIVAPVFADGTVRFYTDRESEWEWRKLLEELTVQGFVKEYRFDNQLVPLSVVGERFAQDGAALNQVVEILARSEISVTMGSASALAVTVAVSALHAEDGVRVLHRELIEMKGASV